MARNCKNSKHNYLVKMKKKNFLGSWKSSKKKKNQNKYRHNAPLHIKQKLISAHLSKELRKRYSKRSIGLRKGDKVKVSRGHFKGKTGKVDMISLKKSRAYLTGIEVIKKDGSKTTFPFHPSNLIITELNVEDKNRKIALERKNG